MGLSRIDSFWRNEDGSVAVTSAIAMTALLSFSALALDSGNLFVDKRLQQSANDFAALAAAARLTSGPTGAASSAAGAAAVSNGFDSASVTKVELGTYVSNPSLPASKRFTPTSTGTPNAVRVTMRQPQPYIFGALLGSASAALAGAGASPTSAMIQTQSVAAARSVASFGIGTGLASLNAGILNGVLGSLVGGSLSLSLMDYQALASANVNLFTFANALGTRAGLTAGTYTTLLAGSVSLPTGLRAATDSVTSSQAATALAAIVSAVGAGSSTLKLGTLLNLGAYGGTPVGSAPPITATVSALSLVTALLEAANGQQQVATALSVALPGIVSANLKLSVGEPPVGSSLIAVGPTGTTLTTAQTRLRLSLQLVGPPTAPLLNVPIALDIASGTAVLNAVQCTGGEVTTSSVQLGVTPGLATAWIGAVSDADLANLSTPLNPPSATLLNVLGLVGITGRANASIANTTPTTVAFGYADITANTTKTVSTTNYLPSLVGSLIGNLSLNVWVLGFNALQTSALASSIGSQLAVDVDPINTVLASVLTGLGVSVGNATVWVNGVQCGQGALVN